eukprot:scaffold79004_cov42-Phaeocystis_antarctica.AAC.1
MLLKTRLDGLQPCSEAGDAGEEAEVDDPIIDRGAQSMPLEPAPGALPQCGQWACAGSFKVHLGSP